MWVGHNDLRVERESLDRIIGAQAIEQLDAVHSF